MPDDAPRPVSTYLAFDVGSRYVGVAVGQNFTCTATALTVLKVSEQGMDWEQCMKLIAQYRPHGLVVGIPYNTGYARQSSVQMAQAFAETLKERTGLPVFTTDEHLSTHVAKAIQSHQQKSQRSSRADAVAAQIILEQWLSERGNP